MPPEEPPAPGGPPGGPVATGQGPAKAGDVRERHTRSRLQCRAVIQEQEVSAGPVTVQWVFAGKQGRIEPVLMACLCLQPALGTPPLQKWGRLAPGPAGLTLGGCEDVPRAGWGGASGNGEPIKQREDAHRRASWSCRAAGAAPRAPTAPLASSRRPPASRSVPSAARTGRARAPRTRRTAWPGALRAASSKPSARPARCARSPARGWSGLRLPSGLCQGPVRARRL